MPPVIVLDGQTRQNTPESGHRAGYGGAKKHKGSKAYIAADTLGQLRLASRFRRLGRDYEGLSVSLQLLHFVVFACLMLARHAANA